MFTSRPPLAFQENNENFREEINVEREILKALWHVAIVGEGFEETLRDLWRHFSPLAPTFIIISDCKEGFKKKERVQKQRLINLLKLNNRQTFC